MDLPVLLVIGLVVIAAFVAVWVLRERHWETFYTSPADDPSEAMRLHGELRAQGLRSRFHAPRPRFLPNHGIAARTDGRSARAPR